DELGSVFERTDNQPGFVAVRDPFAIREPGGPPGLADTMRRDPCRVPALDVEQPQVPDPRPVSFGADEGEAPAIRRPAWHGGESLACDTSHVLAVGVGDVDGALPVAVR